jgi:hypothetical protein
MDIDIDLSIKVELGPQLSDRGGDEYCKEFGEASW